MTAPSVRTVLYFQDARASQLKRQLSLRRYNARDATNDSLTSPLSNFRTPDHKYRNKLFQRIIGRQLPRYCT